MKAAIHRLKNGTRVVTVPLKNRTAVSLGVWVHVGGRDETSRLNGVSHFLEHLLFKGTRTRSAKEIKESVEGVGGSFNAFTSEESTCYLAKISSRHLEGVLDVLCDMTLNATLEPGDIEKERTVILEEIKMTQDQPSQYVDEVLTEILWPGHALGRPIAGTIESVRALTREDIAGYRDTFYAPPFFTVVAAGAVNPNAFLKMTDRRLGSVSKKSAKKFLSFKRKDQKPLVKTVKKDTEQTHLALGVHGFPKAHPQSHAVNVLSVLLGGNMSSRLFNEVREERGLAYEIGSYTKKFAETGAFVVEAGVDNRKVEEALKVILKELRRVTEEPVDPRELDRAKEYYLGQLELGLESSMDAMLWAGESLVCLGRYRTPEEVMRGVKKVSAVDVRRAACTLFKTQSFHLAAIGPKADSLQDSFPHF